jgi:hypothetical protein
LLTRGIGAQQTPKQQSEVTTQVGNVERINIEGWTFLGGKLAGQSPHDWNVMSDLGAATPDDWHKPK